MSNEIPFPSEDEASKSSPSVIAAHKKSNNEFLYRQLEKLGDMMGDGLHYEKGGAWINREYKKILRAIDPEVREMYKRKKQKQIAHINEQMKKITENQKCACGGLLKQTRSGSMTTICVVCGARYKSKWKKK